LRVDGLTVPLDGDLRQLDAKLRLELGEVQYALLPGLEAWFPELAARTSKLPTIEVEIVDGVARYQRLPVKLGGKEQSFSGSYDLVDGKLNLSADVPLAAFGKKVVKELDSLRDILPPDMVVPIELSGSWSSPKLRIKKKFLEDVVERAAQKALEDLFGGGKDKKKP
jgi:RNAse (barnase) inhibitor barstar